MSKTGYGLFLCVLSRGPCVTEDPHDGPPAPQSTEPEGTAGVKTEAPTTGQGSLVFQSTQGGCLVLPPSQDLAPLGALTLAVWLKPSVPGEMYVLLLHFTPFS